MNLARAVELVDPDAFSFSFLLGGFFIAAVTPVVGSLGGHLLLSVLGLDSLRRLDPLANFFGVLVTVALGLLFLFSFRWIGIGVFVGLAIVLAMRFRARR